MNLEYQMSGDYQYPNLQNSGQPEGEVGRYGRMHLEYLKSERSKQRLYADLCFELKLKAYLMDIDRSARERMEQIETQLMQEQGLTEALKGAHQMEWLRRRNQIRHTAEEIVLREIVYN